MSADRGTFDPGADADPATWRAHSDTVDLRLIDGWLVLTLDNAANPKIRLRNALPRPVFAWTGLVPYAVGPSLEPRAARRSLARAGVEVVASRAIANLLSNAIKDSPSESEVEAETAVEGSSLVLRVRDHGPGIAPGDRARLLQKFRRGADVGMSGTGLGLFIEGSIAEAYGGTVSVECPAGDGSIFEIRPPVAPAVESGERGEP